MALTFTISFRKLFWSTDFILVIGESSMCGRERSFGGGLERNVYKKWSKWVYDGKLFGQGSSDPVQDELETVNVQCATTYWVTLHIKYIRRDTFAIIICQQVCVGKYSTFLIFVFLYFVKEILAFIFLYVRMNALKHADSFVSVCGCYSVLTKQLLCVFNLLC